LIDSYPVRVGNDVGVGLLTSVVTRETNNLFWRGWVRRDEASQLRDLMPSTQQPGPKKSKAKKRGSGLGVLRKVTCQEEVARCVWLFGMQCIAEWGLVLVLVLVSDELSSRV
jgi:hypothetical protein